MATTTLVQKQQKKSLRQKIAEKIWRPKRTHEAFERLRKEAGFIPIFNVDDLEIRRRAIKEVLTEVQEHLFVQSEEFQRKIIQKVFALFFTEGDPWYRGLDNRELAQKVSYFLMNCTAVGYLPAFIPDLFEEAMQLLHLSFQAIDVTNTPPYIIESRPVVMPPKTAIVPLGGQQDLELPDERE
jgi:hypothetical protein